MGRHCVPIVPEGSTDLTLGDLGWERPCATTNRQVPAARPAERLCAIRELATDANHGHTPHASDERVKVSPSSARLCPMGIGSLTAQAVRASECTTGSAHRNHLCAHSDSSSNANNGIRTNTHPPTRSYNISRADKSGTAHCCIISAAAPQSCRPRSDC